MNDRMRTLGLVLAVLGAIGLALESFTYITQEQVIDIGPIEASAQVEERVTIPPLAAGAVLVLGLGMTAAASRRG